MLKRFTRKMSGKNGLPEDLKYEQARDLLTEASDEIRTELAGRDDIEPEILYYLATDDSSTVRRQVAANEHTPRQADKLLTLDDSDEVRSELARKIGRILPDLDDENRARVRELTIEVIETLAQDQLPRIRRIVAEEIKHASNVPHHVVTTLAKDVELIVAAPVLEYSPLLNDDDLKEIIATSTVKGALEAIAKRASLSLSVADSIAATLDIPAVAALLANPNAQIREDTLDAIIENAEEIEDWHEPLALRPSLSLRAIRRIASFVGSSLVSIMVERNELPPKVGDEIQRKVRSRIEVEDVEDVEKAEEEPKRPAAPKYDFAKLHAEGKIDDKFMCELIDQSRRPAVVEALGTLTGRKTETVKSILESRNGMAITALCWKAGLAMRTALRLQRDFAMLKPDQILNAKDGVDYPQSPHEMETHLALFPA
jgi:uncharacterized protein (DUF2336 family)